jgi:hypothetical protein
VEAAVAVRGARLLAVLATFSQLKGLFMASKMD